MCTLIALLSLITVQRLCPSTVSALLRSGMLVKNYCHLGNGISVYGVSGPNFGPYNVSLDGAPYIQMNASATNGTDDQVMVRSYMYVLQLHRA